MGNIPRGSPYPQDIRRVFDSIDDSPLLDQLDDYRWTGRKGYTSASMWRAILVKYLLRIRYVRDLIAQLRSSPYLCDLCGFDDDVPSEATFSRFNARLADHTDLIDQALTAASAAVGDTLAQLRADDLLPPKSPAPGRFAAMDSTDIPAYANPDRTIPRDPNARWGRRTAKTGTKEDRTEPFYGYKLHAVCDAYYGTPLSWEILPANDSDFPTLPPLMDQLADKFPRQPVHYLMADRGYDGLSNYQDLHERRIFSVIHMRNSDKSGRIDAGGHPSCIGRQPMRYIRTDRGKGHLFRCDPEAGDGCPLRNSAPWLGVRCVDEQYENWKGDNLRRIGKLARASKRWARLYRMRPTVERMFSSLKRSRLLDDHRCFNIKRVRLHVALSLLTYSGSMLARLLDGDVRHIRDMSMSRVSPVQVALAA